MPKQRQALSAYGPQVLLNALAEIRSDAPTFVYPETSHQWGYGKPLNVGEDGVDWFSSRLENAVALMIDNRESILEPSPEAHAILSEQDIQTLSWLPFGNQSDTAGALILHSKAPQAWRTHEQRFSEEIAQIIRSAIRRMEAFAEKERLMDELNQENKLEAIGKLTGGIAHDFNNMLLPIIGYSDMLLDPQRSGNANSEEVNEIRKAAESAVALTKQLLPFSRNQILEKEPLDLHGLIRDHQKMLARILGEDIQLNLKLSDQDGVVEADRGQMDQVLMNLCVNARDAMPEGGQITIRTALTTCTAAGNPEPNQYLKVTVQDSGHGMDTEVAKRAFDPFYSTKGMEGTGLGLSVVVGIIEQHQGWIDLSTGVGEGTTFDIFLPHLTHSVPEPEPRKAPVETLRESSSAHILLIEDEPGVLAFVKAALEKRGYRITTAKCANEAYRVFEARTSEFDLIFSDAMLPDGTGMDVLEKILGEHPHIPGLLSSGYTDHRAMIDVARANDITFLHKPYALKSLYETVESVLKENEMAMAN